MVGRDILSVTGLAHKLIDDLKPLAGMLSPEDRRIMERFFEAILQQRVAIAEATDLMPLEVALLILLIEERKQSRHEDNELYRQIQELERVVEELRTKK